MGKVIKAMHMDKEERIESFPSIRINWSKSYYSRLSKSNWKNRTLALLFSDPNLFKYNNNRKINIFKRPKTFQM